MSSADPLPAPTMPAPRFFFIGALTAGVLFALWTGFIRPWSEAPAFDVQFANSLHDWSATHPGLRGAMIFLTDLGGIAAMALLTIVAAHCQGALKNRPLVWGWIGVMIGCAILNMGSKHLFNRDRPPAHLRDAVVHETNKSYPSGHAMGSAIGYGMLAYTLVRAERCRWRRLAMLLCCAAIVAGIGCSRIYLRAHWFSDVIAGWLIGLTWLLFCLGWLERYCRKPLAA